MDFERIVERNSECEIILIIYLVLINSFFFYYIYLYNPYQDKNIKKDLFLLSHTTLPLDSSNHVYRVQCKYRKRSCFSRDGGVRRHLIASHVCEDTSLEIILCDQRVYRNCVVRACTSSVLWAPLVTIHPLIHLSYPFIHLEITFYFITGYYSPAHRTLSSRVTSIVRVPLPRLSPLTRNLRDFARDEEARNHCKNWK